MEYSFDLASKIEEVRKEPSKTDILNNVIKNLQNKVVVQGMPGVVHSGFMDMYETFVLTKTNRAKKRELYYYLTDDDLEKYKITIDELKEAARLNMMEKVTTRVVPYIDYMINRNSMVYPFVEIADVPISISGINGKKKNIPLPMFTDENQDSSYILTNRREIFGSSVLLNPETIERVYRKIRNDFYIVPISVHLSVCVSLDLLKKKYDNDIRIIEEELIDYVQCVNETNHDNDILSYNIYRYLKDEECLITVKR